MRIEFDSARSAPRNVMSKYEGQTLNEITEDLAQYRLPMVSVCFNLTGDFNKASIIRSHNAFLGDRVFLVGRRKFDRRGTVGTHHYENIFHEQTFEPVVEQLQAEGYTIFAVDNLPGYDPQPVWEASLPLKSAFVYGEEQAGLSLDAVEQCDGMLYIPQFGSVRSLNVGAAAAVMMGEYSRRHR